MSIYARSGRLGQQGRSAPRAQERLAHRPSGRNPRPHHRRPALPHSRPEPPRSGAGFTGSMTRKPSWLTIPVQLFTPHFSVLPSLHSCHSAPRARRHGPKRGTSFHGADQGDRDHLRVRPPSRRHRIGAAAELAVATQEPLLTLLDAALGERGILFVMDPGNAHARRYRRWMDRSITCGVAPCLRDGASARRGDGRRPWRAPCVRTARRYRQGRRASHTRSASLRARCGTD